MNTYETRLRAREDVADGTMAFHFEKPSGFSFQPGQAIDLILADPGPTADSHVARHTFSIVSAPFQDEVVIATRMRDSAYKHALKSLPIGAAAGLEGPSGSLTLHRDRGRPAVLVAGGIGITPFISMLRHAAREQLPQQLLLLYSNRRPEDAAFLAELNQLERKNRNFRLIATMTQAAKSNRRWEGETGPIDEDRVRTACSNLSAPVFYLAGPPGMVEGIRQSLNDAGINDEDIRSEEFFGY
ncbi:ferredoxin--NADP reductase [Cupriavidus pinatubonensis]|uniref:Methane monooxygenase component C n=1 Tax=Cupriavidus pinatubonensis TaxID=248026 RepID=A0ABN7Z975_9BURK|nr:FAD-dependent oxidoreductase [Cupriavidus pinatubonensis]CAG9180856.1 Methane monooxygenase component C [Cupriavidus pinatubonensis]